jgi:hypothetical protein
LGKTQEKKNKMSFLVPSDQQNLAHHTTINYSSTSPKSDRQFQEVNFILLPSFEYRKSSRNKKNKQQQTNVWPHLALGSS